MQSKTAAVAVLVMALQVAGNAAAQSSENAKLEQQFIGIWRLASWETEYEDGSVKLDSRSESYLIYTDTGHMCWMAMDPNRPKWAGEPTQEQKAEAFDGFGAYCAKVELNVDEGYVVHHVELAMIPDAVGIQRKRWFTFDGPDRLLLRVEPSENVPPETENRLVWERVK